MEREEDRYGELLMRPAWWAMRVVVADKANYRCEKCGKYLPLRDTKPKGEAHHMKYTADYPWNEPLENMQYLCHDCHEATHGRAFGFVEKCRNTQSVGGVIECLKRYWNNQSEKGNN